MSFGANQSGYGPEPTCYRHPNRPTSIRCQRCGRPICADCQVIAPVGVQCPDCVREAAAATTGVRRRGPAFLHRSGAPLVTYAIIAVCVVIWALQMLVPGFTNAVVFYAPFTHLEPWRVLTAGFAHSTSNLLHLPLNMYSLWVFGMLLEPAIGRWRFAVLYLLSLLGGDIAVALLAPATPVRGASWALFGVMAALLLVVRHLGGQYVQLLVLLGVNLVFGFLASGVSWQAHVGGLVVGLVVAQIFLMTRHRNRAQVLLVAVVAVVLVAGLWLATDPARFTAAAGVIALGQVRKLSTGCPQSG